MNTSKAMYSMNVIPTDDSSVRNFTLPRSAYLLQIPCILIFVGLVTLAVDTEQAMAVAAGVAAATAAYMLWDWLFRYGPTRIFQLFVINLLLGYGAGAINSYLTLPRVGGFAAYWGTSEHVLAQGMASILLICAVLCFIGELYEPPLLLNDLRIPVTTRSRAFVYLMTFALIVGFYTHALSFSGISQAGVNSQQNPAAALIAAAFTPIVAVSVASAIAAPRGFIKWSLILCAVVGAVLQTTVDRRAVFYMVILTVFLLRTTGYRVGGNFFRNVILFGALGVFAFFGITFFMLLRLAGYQNTKALSLPERVETIATWVADGSALQRASDANGSNIKKRSFVLGFYADVLEGSTNKAPAMGVNLVTATVASIPRVLDPDKESGHFMGVRLMAEEPLSDELFGLTYTDAANSIITAGAVDYGVLGAFLFPILLALVTRKCLDISFRYLDDFSSIFLAAAAVVFALPTETALYAYFSGIRNLILFAILLYIFQRMPKFAWTRD